MDESKLEVLKQFIKTNDLSLLPELITAGLVVQKGSGVEIPIKAMDLLGAYLEESQ